MEAVSVAYNTYRSCLIPYEHEIVALRRNRPPVPYSKIAEILRDKYQIDVRTTTIIRFLQVRVKGFKSCKYAWDIEPITSNNQPTIEVPLTRKPTIVQKPKPAPQDKTEPTVQTLDSSKPGRFEMQFSETYNLTRLPPEEAAAWRKKLEEKEKRR